MKDDKSLTIGVVAASYPAALKLFDVLSIDYASHGDLTISEAAELEGLDPNGLVEAVAEVVLKSTPLWLDKSLGQLITAVETHHHALSRELLFRTRLRLNEAYQFSSIDEARTLRSEFTDFAADLLQHIEYEEIVLFPLLRSLEVTGSPSDVANRVDYSCLKAGVQKLLRDHFALGAAAQRLTALCATIESTHSTARSNPDALRSVRAVEKHRRHYMTLENNILFPRALAIAERISKESSTSVNPPREKRSVHSRSANANANA